MNKTVISTSEMSNLINKWAFWVVDGKILQKYFICGKASNDYFICQVISPWDGSPNVAVLMNIDQLKQMFIISSVELAQELQRDYDNHGIFRYKAITPEPLTGISKDN